MTLLLSKRLFPESRWALLSLVFISCIIVLVGVKPFPAFALNAEDDVHVALASVDNDILFNTQYIAADGRTFVPDTPPTNPGPQALSEYVSDFATSRTVSTQSDLQLALNDGVEQIILANPITLTSSVTINNSSEYHVVIEATSGTLSITAAQGQRHFTIAATSALYLSFQNVVLQGNALGGGIVANGTVTISNPQIENCFISTGTEGGGLYANGAVKVEGGSITGCKALRGGGIFCTYGKSLTVTDVSITNNQARHTAAADSGLGGGIGVGQYGSLVAKDCTISGNVATGDTSNTKGLGGGIGSWTNSYAEITTCTIRNNMAGNFGGGILSHWNSTLIVSGGAITQNDVSASQAYGSGGGVCLAAGGHAQFRDDLVISDNKALYGAGIRFEHATTTTIEQVTFSDNTANQTGGTVSCGGTDGSVAMATLSIKTTSFNGSTARAGGVIYLGRKFTVQCFDTTFSHNAAESSGGVLYALQESDVTFTDTEISDNKALYGGAIYMSSATGSATTTPLNLVRTTVHDNEADTTNAASQAGGILLGNYCSATLDASRIENNKGGYGGGLAVFNYSSLRAINSTRIADNEAIKSGGGIYVGSSSTLTLENAVEVADNTTEVSGGGAYLSYASSVIVRDSSSVTGNKAVGYGGGIAGSQAQAITVRDQAHVSDNIAKEYGGGIYAHTGTTSDRNTVVTVQDNASISMNSAAYGAGISAASPDWDTSVPTVSLVGQAELEGNIAEHDGGGIWVPHTDLARVSAEAGVNFADNKADQGYYMSSTSPDALIHAQKILTTKYSDTPSGAPAFSYAYNNYDIVHRDGLQIVTVTFVGEGGNPDTQQSSTMEGSSLGSSLVPDPIRTSYTFLGWYTLPNGGGTLFDAYTVVDADITVYAYWSKALPPAPPDEIPVVPPGAIPAVGDASGGTLWTGLLCTVLLAGSCIVYATSRRIKR